MDNTEKIRFLAYQTPALDAGDYKITLTQSVDTGRGGDTYGTQVIDFAVFGERFSLNPSEVHVMFPPPGSLGRHSDCLPHISIKRSTFPWERSAYGDAYSDEGKEQPWLALLLFDEQELRDGDVKKETITLKDLKDSDPALFPAITLETGQEDTDTLNVIDVRKSLLQTLMPAGEELRLLSHVRQRVNGDEDNPETELAVIMGNRLPKEGSGSFVHLVSVENRYSDNMEFDYASANDDDFIRLVSLKHWSFACLADLGKTFEELVEDINTGGDEGGVVRLPRLDKHTPAEEYLSRGYVALPHQLRQCDKTYSWYHSPLSPQEVASTFTADSDLPEFGDALIRYHKDIGMFDTTYAAAYELGRVLAIEDNTFSEALYLWKHQHNEKIAMGLQQPEIDQLVAGNSQADEGESRLETKILETKIITWFKELATLKYVPFNYLIPDEKMLPDESIRFFKLDNHWIECLLYGAFSIGGNIRTGEDDGSAIIDSFKELTDSVYTNPRSGFLVRSELVSDYPDLLVDTYSEKVTNSESIELTNVRTERMSTDVLFYLVEGAVGIAELYLKPEGLHFGLDEEDADDGIGMKYEKDIDGTETPLDLGKDILNEKRVLNINQFAEKIKETLEITEINPAQFGMYMIEGSNKGRFVKA